MSEADGAVPGVVEAAARAGSEVVAHDASEGDAHAAADPHDPRHRRIRSFVTRAGRVSPAQQRARDTLGARYIVPFADETLDCRTVFGRDAPVVLEIGFGMGAATAVMAAARRDVDFIGIEVHAPGVGALLKMIGEQDLQNLRIVEHDAVEVIERMIAPASLAGALIYFPDPWHKARHNKRRLIQPGFVATLAGRVADGGFVHCATDWEEYAVQMQDVLSAEPSLVNSTAGYATADNPIVTRPVTKFETRGKRLGHGVWDVVFTKRSTQGRDGFIDLPASD